MGIRWDLFHADLRHRQGNRLDGAHHGTAQEQPHHPPTDDYVRAVRPQGRAD
jgi:hypothetical protein